MNVKAYQTLLTLVWLALLALSPQPTTACSCMPSHPQTHFCQADYVVLIRVMRRSHRLVANKVAYKVEIKRSYKMTPEGHKMLKHGRMVTANSEASCGVNLDIGRLYVVAGRAPYLNMCSYVKEYLNMSVVERRGFAGGYGKSCDCEVKPCFGNQCLRDREGATACKWSPFAKCETTFSACTPSTFHTPEGRVSKCHWRRTPSYKACLADP